MSETHVLTIHEPVTGTWQYIVADTATREAVIIDPVLDYDRGTGAVSTTSADKVLEKVSQNGYNIVRILETHAHADHLTASRYLQAKLGSKQQSIPKVCIGKRIRQVQETMSRIYSIPPTEMADAFDQEFADHETFSIGKLDAEVIPLPGHTPDHVGYVIGNNVFAGDSIFNPDIGSGRCDFPGGSATELYRSIQRLLSLDASVKLYTGHDYPPPDRAGGSTAVPYTTVEEQRKSNKHAKVGTDETSFVQWRNERDSSLNEPKLMCQAMHTNTRGGRLPATDVENFTISSVPPYVLRVGT